MDRTCIKCKVKNPQTGFGVYSRNADGINNTCRGCLRDAKRIKRLSLGIKPKPKTEEEKKANRKASVKKYLATHAARLRARRAEMYRENPKRFKEASDRWKAKNPGVEKRRAVKYRLDNPDKVKAATKKWREGNPEVCRVLRHNRRARVLKNGGKLSPGLAPRLFNLQRGKCACCGLPLGDDYHLDHILPIALGGANEDWNIQLLRSMCNLKKHAKHPIDYMQSKGMLL